MAKQDLRTFEKRFDIQVDTATTLTRFRNRILNQLPQYIDYYFDHSAKQSIARNLATFLGERYLYGTSIVSLMSKSVFSFLKSIEFLYISYPVLKKCINQIIEDSVAQNEVDIGISWKRGIFVKKGAELLDNKLINQTLEWLRKPGFVNVLVPFEKALSHFAKSAADPSLLHDVITDAYEALEALAKSVTGKDQDLSANKELFIKQLKASEGYKKILSEYIMYACKYFRHAQGPGKIKPQIKEHEAESFLYLTGLFLRFGIESSRSK